MNTQKSGNVAQRRISLRAALMLTTALTVSMLVATPVYASGWSGTTGDWFDPANWGGGVPTSGNTATIDNGGTAQIGAAGAVSSQGSIGGGASTSGTVEVSGTGSSWTVSNGLDVGFQGDGTLSISDGGTVSNTNTTLGGLLGSIGSVTVDGDGSVWTNTYFTVGNIGDATLDITNGGEVHSTSVSIAFGTGSGDVTVDGTGSTLSMLYALYVGYDGAGTLAISDGGTVSSQGAYVGFDAGSESSVTVDGEGSVLAVDGALTVGYEGEGTLDITGGGAVSGYGIYAGQNATGSGSITVDGVGSSLTSSIAVYVAYDGHGELTVANSGTVVANEIQIAVTSGSTGTVNIGAAASDAAVAAGVLDVASISFGAGTGALIFNHTDTDYELDANISGSGAMRQIGSGSTTLSGDSSGFTGTTSVEDGELIVDGSLGGTLSVGDARLAGSGTVGSVTLGNGSVIAPGHSGVGTLNVAGDLTFDAGSTYEVEVDPAHGTNDLIHVTGTAYLNNASVEHVGVNGPYPWYMTQTILTADGGINGTFGSVTSNYAFLTPDLSYDANNVRLTLLRNDIDFAEVTQSPNQTGVAGATNGLGIGNPIYDQIVTMTEAEARAAFDALSGEAYGSTDSAAVSSVQQIRDVLQNRIQSFSGGSQVSSLGNGLAAGDSPAGALPAVWGQVFGSWGLNNATANFAQIDRRTTGFLGGADKPVGEVSRVGVALGYSRSDFDVSARSSSGDSDNFHVAGYAGTKLGVLDLSGTVGYSYGRAEAKRVVIVGGLTNNLSADYDTHTVQASVEAGTDLDLRSVVLTPFAGLAATYVRTDSFTETGGPAALTVAGADNTTGTSSLGLRIRHDAGHVALTGSAAWRHAFGDVDPASRVAFASAPAASFLVRGAPISEDALAVGAQINLALTDWTNLSFGYTGEFASEARDQGLRSELRVEF
ncbi:MAG: autotransporter outer membrane beta-barrel domain-containing protein [Parvibaculaceae bacterium]